MTPPQPRAASFVLACLSALLAAACARPGPARESSGAGTAKVAADGPGHEALAFVGGMKVHRYRLANGLKLLVVENHASPTFAIQTWYDVGSRDEEVGRTGLAHLFEHMMFKETKNLK